MPGAEPLDPAYVAARRVLLDALEALGPHRRAVVLVGAQAIYWHVGAGDLAVAPHTTDGDLVIDPRALGEAPDLARALAAAGFVLTVRPGTWTRRDVPIDLIVPAVLGGPGRRGARLGRHGSDIARKTSGLEAAVVDHVGASLGSFERRDRRAFDVRVAGLAALLVAKLQKINDRREAPVRTADKDALDVLRILRFADETRLSQTLRRLAADPVAGAVTTSAMGHLRALFGRSDALGAQMAVRATAALEDAATVANSCEALSVRLLAAWRVQGEA